MMFNYDSFAKLRIFRNKAMASRLNIVNACLEWGDLRVKAPDSRKHENNVDKRYIHPNKQSLGHLGEQNAYRGFFI